jgi:hypothetical protein
MNSKIYKIKPLEERYIESFFNLEIIYNEIIPYAIRIERFFVDNLLDNYMITSITNNNYDIKKDPYLNVKTFEELLEYMKLYILSNNEDSMNGIICNKGPLSYETNLIQNKLLQFYNKGFITFDSEPGLISIDTNTNLINIQKPYVFIFGDSDKIDYIQQMIGEHNMLSCIEYSNDEFKRSLKRDFKNLDNIDNKKFGFFGVREISENELKDFNSRMNYYEYIFSNKFFDDILNLC